MIKYDLSDRESMIRSFRGTKVYMANHPEIREHFRRDKRPTEFGDKVWNMTLRMMKYLEHEEMNRVLDLGCGWGLLGIHLARVNAAEVTCTDIDPRLGPLVQKHAELNKVSVDFISSSFHDLTAKNLNYDLVVGSEICYCEEVSSQLCQLADSAAEGGTKRLLIADPGRPDFEDLYDYCRKRHGAELIDIKGRDEQKSIYLLSIKY